MSGCTYFLSYQSGWIVYPFTVTSKFQLSLSFDSRKFYVRRNNNKVDSIEEGHIVIADLLP